MHCRASCHIYDLGAIRDEKVAFRVEHFNSLSRNYDRSGTLYRSGGSDHSSHVYEGGAETCYGYNGLQRIRGSAIFKYS